MKGCFGKILTFVLGMVIGVVLFVGTIVGVGYYFVTQVTVGQIQEMSNQQFLDENAEIMDASILDVGKLLFGGGLSTITVDEVKAKFGIDVIALIESNLDIRIEDSPEKEKLKNTPVLKLAGQMDILLNCISLNTVQSVFGLELPDFPLIQDHIAEPVMMAINSIMGEFNFDTFTLGDLEYKLGVTLDAEVLQSLKEHSINEMGSALENLALYNIIPDFDRDFYFKKGDDKFILIEEYQQITFSEVYTLIESGQDVNEKHRYKLDEESGFYIQDSFGNYKKAEVSGIDRYKREGEIGNYTYIQNSYGNYMVADDTKSNERFSFNTQTNSYEADKMGEFKFISKYIVATAENSIDKPLYVPKYIDFIDDIDEVLKLKQNGFAPVICEEDEVGKKEYRLNGTIFEINYGNGVEPDWQTVSFTIISQEINDSLKNSLIEDINGDYTLVHIGKTERILKTLADCSIATLNSKIGELSIKDVMDVDGDKYRQVDEIELLDAEFLSINKNELFVTINSLYYHYNADNPSHGDLPVYLRTYKGSSHATVKQLANIGVTDIGNRMSDVLDSLIIRDIIEIKDDYYENMSGLYVKVDGQFILYNSEIHSEDLIRYSAPSHIIVKKIADISVGNLGAEMQSIIDTTTIGEIINIKRENAYTEDANGAYGILAIIDAESVESTYFGTYETLYFYEESIEKCKILVKYSAEVAYAEPTRYNIYEKSTSNALASMADITIGNMGGQMQGIIDDMKLNDVAEIDGDVYTKLGSTEYDLAVLESGDEEVYYNDNGMYRPAFEDSVTTEYYKKIYNGKTNTVFKKLSTIEIAQITNRISDAIDDTTLYELGIVTDSTTGVLAQDTIKNAKIKDLPNAINDTISGATVRQLNDWGNLEMGEDVLNALYIANGNEDMTAYDFFSKLEIKGYDPETGSPLFGFKN